MSDTTDPAPLPDVTQTPIGELLTSDDTNLGRSVNSLDDPGGGVSAFAADRAGLLRRVRIGPGGVQTSVMTEDEVAAARHATGGDLWAAARGVQVPAVALPLIVQLIDGITTDAAVDAIMVCQRLGLLEEPRGGWLFPPAGVDPQPLIDLLTPPPAGGAS